MDRELSKEVRRKEAFKQWTKVGIGLAVLAVVVFVLVFLIQTTLKRKDLMISTVEVGTIEVSASASGKVVPAFEEIITSPINSRIVEIYKKGGDRVNVGDPILRLDLQTAENDYNKLLDEQEKKRLELEQLRLKNQSKLSEMEMKLKVSRMTLNRKEVELRNERYLDELGAGTTDKVLQAELDYNVSQLELAEDEQKYENEKALTAADLKVKELEFSIFQKGLAEMKRNGVISFTVQLEEDNHTRLRSGLRTDVYVMNAIKEEVMRIANPHATLRRTVPARRHCPCHCRQSRDYPCR